MGAGTVLPVGEPRVGARIPFSVFPGEKAHVQRPCQAALGTQLLAVDLEAIS